ncbi:MAG: class I SAM-dependent methyltransferase [Candidatus Limnocylindria bacterium]
MHGKGPRSCCDQDVERRFDDRAAARDLRDWQRNGLPDATAELIRAFRAWGVQGAAILDVGAGVGMVHLELIAAGAASALDVDLSTAYLAVARDEAERRGVGDRVTYRFGDVTELAAELPPADVVALDRVICCYLDLPALLAAVMLAGPRLIGLVHPTDRWWMRASMGFFNALSRVLRRHHSFYVHRQAEIDRLLRAGGFVERHDGGGRVWRVAVYVRSPA